MERPNDQEPELLEPELLDAKASSRLSPRMVVAGAFVTLLAASLFLFASDPLVSIGELGELRPTEGIIVPLSPSDPAAIDGAIQGLHLGAVEKTRIRTAVEAGALDVGLLIVWDYMDQDGDVVAVSSAGFIQNITIVNAPTPIVIPYDGPSAVTVTGLHDGGGGITVAVASGGGPMQLRPLLVGESVEVRIP